MGHRIQKLRKHVGSRVASTMKGIRTRAYKGAGFPAAPSSDHRGDGCSQGMMGEEPDPSHVQLHNTLIRALLAVPVSYEPSRLLKRTQGAVLIITGADLVLVKMSKSAAASSTLPHSNPAAAELKEAGFYEDAEATVADGSGRSSADFAQKTVLAQHELNKMIKCQVVGTCLELEFIMTGSASFKVSAAALGFSSSGAPEATRTESSPGTLIETVTGHDEASNAVMQAGESHQQVESAVTSHPDADSPCAAEASGGEQSSSLACDAALADIADTAAVFPAATRFSAPGGLESASRSLSAPAEALARSSTHGANSSLSSVHWAAHKHRSNSGYALLQRRSSSTAGAVMNGIGRSASYVKSLGSSMSAYVPTWEDASRSVGSTMSSFRMVKTDEGHYWVCVESFTLQFRDVPTCEVAADLLLTGKANMRAAVDWLKLGLPFKPDIAVTHITEVSSNRAGTETLVSGSVGWNTDLKLPTSWARAISSPHLPQDQLLMTPLRVSDGPAAFRIHISTPAGLAVATLVPELLALLAQHPHPQGQVLAVPVDPTLSTPASSQHAAPVQNNKQQDNVQLLQQQVRHDNGMGLKSDQSGTSHHHSFRDGSHADADVQARRMSGVLTRHALDSAVDATTSTASSSSSSAAAARHTAPDDVSVTSSDMDTSRLRRVITIPSRPYASAKVAAKGLFKKVVTFREGPLNDLHLDNRNSSSKSAPCLVGPRRSALRDDAVPFDRLPPHNSRSGVRVLAHSYSRRSKSQPAALDTFDAAADGVQDEHTHQTASAIDRGVESDGASSPFAGSKSWMFGSSDDLTAIQHQPSSGFRRYSRFARQQSGQPQGRGTRDSGSCSSSGTGKMSQHNRQQQQQVHVIDGQQEQHLSFVKEVYAVLHVQLLHGSYSDGSRPAAHTVSTAGSAVKPSGLSMQEAAAAGTASDDSQQVDHAGVDVLGRAQGTNPGQLTHQQCQLLSAAGLLAIVLCIMALLWLNSAAGPLLVFFASVINIACLAVSENSAQLRRISRWLMQLWRLRRRPAHAFPKQGVEGEADMQAVYDAEGQDEQTLAHTYAVHNAADDSSGLRLRLLGAGFVREPLGLLQEQISAFKLLQERTAAVAAAALPDGAVDFAEAEVPNDIPFEGFSAAADDEVTAPLISSPEPEWMTPDWRNRILAARPTSEERRKLADYVHSWRRQYGADRMLKQRPPNFTWFQQQLQLKPLFVTPQGHVVLLLKMASLVQASRNLAAAGLTASDMTAYCGFIWSFMFEVLAAGAYPSGRLIMVTDMREVKLGQAVGEGQVGARALGAVCSAWPERLVRCLVLGTPSWFNMLYRLVRPHLSPSTSAKIQVCNEREAAVELELCLGPELVPKAYGGSCSLPLDEYPAQRQLLEFVAGLQS